MMTTSQSLLTKRVVLGVSGGIAAYKAVEILRNLQRKGAEVRVIMTRNATRFITPLTLSVLSGFPVVVDMFPERVTPEIEHISLADRLDLLLIAPATANIIGKCAAGIADDFLSTFYLSTQSQILIAPAMNWKMYTHPTVQENLKKLVARGVALIEPEEGDLACQEQGTGRLAHVDRIVEKVVSLLTPQRLKAKKILISAGPTREFWDSFRFLSNPSTGKMGYALARVARDMGATVTLVAGPTSLPVPDDIIFISVESAAEMENAIVNRFEKQDIIIMAAAVSDFRPIHTHQHKLKKENAPPHMELTRTTDILKELGTRKSNQLLIGFAAETENLRTYAQHKLLEKNLDLIIANQIGSHEAGFASDTNRCHLLFKNGQEKELALAPKDEIARTILEHIASLAPD